MLHKDKFGPLARMLREYETNETEMLFADKANILSVTTKTNEVAVQASFIISQITAKK
jgi:hypothetical protein